MPSPTPLNKYLPSEILDIYLSNFKDNIYITYYSTVILNIQNGVKKLIANKEFPSEEKIIVKELKGTFKIKELNLYE